MKKNFYLINIYDKLLFRGFYSFSVDRHDKHDTEIFLSSVTFPYFRAPVTLIRDLLTRR